MRCWCPAVLLQTRLACQPATELSCHLPAAAGVITIVTCVLMAILFAGELRELHSQAMSYPLARRQAPAHGSCYMQKPSACLCRHTCLCMQAAAVVMLLQLLQDGCAEMTALVCLLRCCRRVPDNADGPSADCGHIQRGSYRHQRESLALLPGSSGGCRPARKHSPQACLGLLRLMGQQHTQQPRTASCSCT